MSISDERFELNMQGLEADGLPGTAAELRARDTAQREALARVEAEWDYLTGCLEETRHHWYRESDALRDVQAQLADVLYILDQHRTWTGMGWEQLPVPVHAAEKIRSKLAQAEQQEARNAEAASESLRYENRRIEQVEPLRVPHPLEAQEAQAGEFQREDRYIVIKRKDFYRLPMEMRLQFSMALRELAPRLPKREYLVIESDWPEYEPTWAAIQARVEGRAALATQPAVVHGDEAVRKDAARYQALRNTPEIFIGVAEGDDMVFLKSPDQLDQLADNAAAMRAQDDGV